MHRLVQVGGGGRVDGDKLDLAPVDGRQLEVVNGARGFGEDIGREFGAHLELRFQGLEGLGQRGASGLGIQGDVLVAHIASITTMPAPGRQCAARVGPRVR